MKNKNIILLHGWGASTAKLEPLGQALRKNKWHVLIPQLPGFDAPEPEGVWGVDKYAEYVSLWAAKAFGEEKYFVFGHSFGGRIATNMAFSSKGVEGIILCATGGISRPNKLKRAVFFIFAKVGKVFLFFAPLANFWRKVIYKVSREHDYEKASPKMKQIFQRVVRENLMPLIPKIKKPIFILWGWHDRVTPVSDAYTICSVAQNFKMFIFPDQGHRLPYELPQQVAEKIQQWAENF